MKKARTKDFVVAETVTHFHKVTVDDEVEFEKIINRANEKLNRNDYGYNAIEEELKELKDRYGFDYDIKPNYCGTIVNTMTIEGEF